MFAYGVIHFALIVQQGRPVYNWFFLVVKHVIFSYGSTKYEEFAAERILFITA
jgi:hypothetical protein